MSRKKIALWVLALLVCAGFARLGFWQYARMQEKQARLDEVAAVLRDKVPLSLVSDHERLTPVWVQGDGRIEPGTLFLDNQMREGRQGVHVYCVLDVGRKWGGGHRLVDFGWIVLPGDRTLPNVACPAGPMHVSGLLLDAPSTGIRMGEAMQAKGPQRWLMTRVESDAIEHATGYGELWPSVVRLDPALKIGYARDLDVLPNTLPPERHLGYAVQWWALSLAVFITALVLSIRKPRKQ